MSTKEHKLAQIIQSIEPADAQAMDAARKRWGSLAKPVGGLGLLEDIITQVAGVQRTAQVRLDRRELIVTCADNGVAARGVSASHQDVTRTIAQALGEGTSTACLMARQAGCDVIPVDVGMREGPDLPGVLVRSSRVGGTDDMTQGPAMMRDECVAAILGGVQLVRERREAGASILLVGEMGIGNTATSTAVACCLLAADPATITGPGTGLSKDGVARKAATIRKALATNRPDPSDPVDVLHKVGGLDLATLCGICLGGALWRVPILLDGIITLAAAACAVRLCPTCRFALIASHVSEEPSARLLLEAVGVDAPIHAHMHLGEGTGALAALSLIDMAHAVYANSRTLDELSIDGYHPAAEGQSCSRSS